VPSKPTPQVKSIMITQSFPDKHQKVEKKCTELNVSNPSVDMCPLILNPAHADPENANRKIRHDKKSKRQNVPDPNAKVVLCFSEPAATRQTYSSIPFIIIPPLPRQCD
jgi:hypothetical protein